MIIRIFKIFKKYEDTLSLKSVANRDPVDLFESLWSYAGMGSYYNTDLETFALSDKVGHLANRAYRY